MPWWEATRVHWAPWLDIHNEYLSDGEEEGEKRSIEINTVPT